MKKIINIFFIIFLSRFCFSQDPQLSQFYSSPLYLSPSMAGTTDGSRVAFNYRDQWPKLPGSFLTYSFSFDHSFANYNSGVGILFMRDEAGGGVLNYTNLGIQYSYDVIINHLFHIRPGIHYYFFQKNIAFNKTLFSDQILTGQISGRSIEIPPEEKVSHSDMGLSALAYTKDYWVGATADHLMKINKNLSSSQGYAMLKISIYGGYKLMLPSHTRRRAEESLSFSFLYKNQDQNNQLDIGFYLTKQPLLAGIWYRGIPLFSKTKTHDAISLMAGYMNGPIQIGYSYDFTISRLATSTGGSHEISLLFLFNQNSKKKKRKKIVPVPCPNL